MNFNILKTVLALKYGANTKKKKQYLKNIKAKLGIKIPLDK
jgi:DNA-binding CsgD family transcriptional regulator